MRAYSRKRVMITFQYITRKGEVSNGGTVYNLKGRHKMTEGDLINAHRQIVDGVGVPLEIRQIWLTGYQYM